MATKFNYAKSQNTADKLIKKFGGRGAIQQYPSYTEYPVDLVVLDYEDRLVDGTRIKSTDKQIFVSVKGLAITIALEDRIKDAGGTVYEIVPPLKPLDPSGAKVVFVEVQGRS